MKKKKDSNFGKQVLTRYIETECERQLLLDLSQKGYPEKWYLDKRDIERATQFRNPTGKLAEMGTRYEGEVYEYLTKLKNSKFNLDSEGKVANSRLNKKEFLELYDELNKSSLKNFILLEFEYSTPKLFLKEVFKQKKPNGGIPVYYSSQRPDIILLRKLDKKDVDSAYELLPRGKIREITQKEYKERFAINIIDIKNVREDHIGKRQFVEIFYYLWTLAYYISQTGLNERFFVYIEDNGIFPQLEKELLKGIHTTKDIMDHSVMIHWEESFQIFNDVINKIQELWNKAPIYIESVPLTIQPNCGYCYFLEDCKKTLNYNKGKNPKDWSLKLIPYTSVSIAQKLEELGFKTVGDLVGKVNSIKCGSIPEPLYSELPLLNLKTKAIVQNNIVTPPAGHTHTYSIPRYSSISITFAVETDPANQRVYTAGYFLDISVSPNAPFGGVFNNWWKIWKEALSKNKTPKEIQKELNSYLLRPITDVEVQEFLYILNKLKNVLIFLKGEPTKSGSKRKQTRIIYQFAAVNKDITNTEEAKFTKEVIKKLYYLFEFCNILENYIVTEGFKAGTYFGPSTSLFYWSKRQLNNFQDMLERNLGEIVEDIEVYKKYLKILYLFSPTDSEIENPYQHKKLFNVQTFVETLLGVPTIISYTWHEVANLVDNTMSSKNYWIPHFNYMDFNNWYSMILKDDVKEKTKIKKKIQKQIMHKVRTINKLRKYFQIRSNFIISQHSHVISREVIQRAVLDDEYHPIAKVWYLFSRLTGSLTSMEVLDYRTIYPEFSIGKMNAAKVENLQIHNAKNKYYYTFQILGLSSNMKIDIGDRVLLIPDELRDINSNGIIYAWIINIEKMSWNSRISGYEIQSETTYTDIFQKIKKNKEILEDPKDMFWYLYPTSMDPWSGKLYGDDGLLQRENMGKSWLGFRLSYLWNIKSKRELRWPEIWKFSAPSIYYYYPKLIYDLDKNNPISTFKQFISPVDPTPDKSQKKAIKLALNRVISGIQGPPGTGKSQTIAALIDEYYERTLRCGKKSVKILITAFSYAAIRVLIDKIRMNRNKSGNPTRSSRLQMIFLRSNYQEPIQSKKNCRDVDDLVRYGGTWKLNQQPRTVTKTNPLEESLEESFIMFGNAHQLYHLPERVSSDFHFDLICVDEASQLPVDHFLSSLQYIKKPNIIIKKPKAYSNPKAVIEDTETIETLKIQNPEELTDLTKVIIVGDYNQLPPVQPVPPPKNLEKVLESLFAYYVKQHEIPNAQLQINYRSNKDIVEFTSSLSVYSGLKAFSYNADRKLKGRTKNIKLNWVRKVLDPNIAVISIIHERKYEIGVSALEAEIVVQLLRGYFEMVNPKTKEEETEFWKEKVGVVAPHNAQGRVIIRKIYDELKKNKLTKLDPKILMQFLKNTIYSVEKFQGSDRELIISSIGISDKDQLTAEGEFIYNLNRFNVLTSRAKSKVILVASRRFLKFIPREREIMKDAAYIRNYAFEFCNKTEVLKVLNENNTLEEVSFRYKS
ncbi:MAG: AAA family ATPase [Candidatus Lokiarchaeota archaeon]|nr:AAA family ATPase [Candidatus Lokiarchaeota archaeon]MBD3198565.1 AAA family ATPase [Candidatus Lokiarchaeota archaeon]